MEMGDGIEEKCEEMIKKMWRNDQCKYFLCFFQRKYCKQRKLMSIREDTKHKQLICLKNINFYKMGVELWRKEN